MKSKDNKKTLKSIILNWYENTRLHRWWFNRRNGVIILSKKEFDTFCLKFGVKQNIIVEEVS